MVWEDKIRLVRNEIREKGKDGRKNPGQLDQILYSSWALRAAANVLKTIIDGLRPIVVR